MRLSFPGCCCVRHVNAFFFFSFFRGGGGNYVVRAQELCESRGGRPWLPVPNSPYGLCGRKATLKSKQRSSVAV